MTLELLNFKRASILMLVSYHNNMLPSETLDIHIRVYSSVFPFKVSFLHQHTQVRIFTIKYVFCSIETKQIKWFLCQINQNLTAYLF